MRNSCSGATFAKYVEKGDLAVLPHGSVQIENQDGCAGHYRELAVDTLTRSETANSADARMHYLLLAAHWYERALECERHPDDDDG
jgi:hypothetical protein